MLDYTGSTGSELVFYNCCFTTDIPEISPDSVPLYASLVGLGQVNFSYVCFDRAENVSVAIDDTMTVTYDHPETMFGDCECMLPQSTLTTFVDVKGSSNAAIIAGSVIGILLIIAIILIIIFLLLRRRRKWESSTEEDPPDEEHRDEETVTTISDMEATQNGGNVEENPLFQTPLDEIFGTEYEEKTYT